MFDITPAERSEHKLYHDYNSRYYSIILGFNMRNQVLRYTCFSHEQSGQDTDSLLLRSTILLCGVECGRFLFPD